MGGVLRGTQDDGQRPEPVGGQGPTRFSVWRIAVLVLTIVSILLTAAIALPHLLTSQSRHHDVSSQHRKPQDSSPSTLEHADGYTPEGEIQLPGMKAGDHVVKTLKTDASERYVYWTTGTERTTALTIAGARHGSDQGNSVTIDITLRRRAAMVNGTPHISEDGVIDATSAGLIGNGTTSNTNNFNTLLQLLPKESTITLSFPEGHFAFTGVLNMVSNLNILGTPGKTYVQMPAGTVGDMVIWYPTGGAKAYDGTHDVSWKNITFQGDYRNLTPTQTIFQSVMHASDISFDNCTFDMIQRPFGHILDVDGSTGVTVRNSTVIGSPNRGQTFKEAFQMDVAALGASGYYDKETVFNNLPTTHMTIENNRFLPLRSESGRLLLPAAAPFGTHMAYAKTPEDESYIRFGTFTGNYVENAAAFEGAGTENSAVIHFDAADDITISDNTFVWTGETPQPSWAVAFYSRSHRMVKPKAWHGITITGNTFKNFSPRRGAFVLYQEPDSVTVPGPSVSQVTVAHNSFEGTPRRIGLLWQREYFRRFIVTHDQHILGHGNTVDGDIHLEDRTDDQ
ncbi:glycosyl hydrolase family 28-related protein [Bifidobacterium crudilactis]|uniref:glycosyl hydrolase family 28-related protein n=2 Tax=Bifidobacterium crudilactis TaxID=327277 RepID=UPI003A5BA84A